MWLNPVLNEDNVSGTLNTNIRVSATENQDVCARIILKNVDDQVILERNIELEDKRRLCWQHIRRYQRH